MRLLFLIFWVSIFGIFSIPHLYAEQNKFVVTAYYSPLPNQEYYSMGSYEAEVILNGQGIAGASGKEVFSGMLAAPQGYAFGTKIYLEGLGIGSVEDRGGAIVPAGERGYKYDRIDVWMGYGDEGLRRAMYWGKRTIIGNIVPSSSQTSLDYGLIPAPDWAVSGFKKQQTQVLYTEPTNIFEGSVSGQSSEKLVGELQGVLSELGYLQTSEITQIYDENTKNAVLVFQLEYGVVSSSDTLGATMYGPKTRAMLQSVYDEYLAQEAKFGDIQARYNDILKKSQHDTEIIIENLGSIEFGDISPEVRELQKILNQLGYFNHKDTAIFGEKTREAIIRYQLDNNIISNRDIYGSGMFGPKTREQMRGDLQKMYLENYISNSGLREEFTEYVNEKK